MYASIAGDPTAGETGFFQQFNDAVIEVRRVEREIEGGGDEDSGDGKKGFEHRAEIGVFLIESDHHATEHKTAGRTIDTDKVIYLTHDALLTANPKKRNIGWRKGGIIFVSTPSLPDDLDIDLLEGETPVRYTKRLVKDEDAKPDILYPGETPGTGDLIEFGDVKLRFSKRIVANSFIKEHDWKFVEVKKD